MITALLVAALTGCVAMPAMPAMAGDKPKPRPVHVLPTGVLSKVRDHVVAPDLPGRTSGRGVPTTFVLPPSPGGVEHLVISKRRLILDRVSQDRSVVLAPSNGTSLWNGGSPIAEITGEAGGSYAVRDYLAAQRKPRQRQTPLGAMFVLRLDGEEESPSFSVGGGGVPAALWGVVPRD